MGRSISLRNVCMALFVASMMLAAATVQAGKPKENEEKPAQAKPLAIDISAGVLAGETPAGVRIEHALDEPTELDCHELPLTDLVDFFKTRHWIGIQIDHKALEEAGVALDTPFTRHLTDISLRSALKLLLRASDLTFVIRDETLLITTMAEAEAMMVVRVYPVADLLNYDSLEVVELHPARGLIENIIGTVAANTWSEVGGAGSIQYSSSADSLVIAQTDSVHEEVREVLTALRKARTLEPKHVAAHGDGKLVVIVYPVSAMTVAHHAAATPAAASDNNVAEKGEPAAKSPVKLVASNRGLADDLVRAIPKLIEPSSWQAQGGPGTIETVSIGVIVRQTPQVHREVARLLSTVDRRGPGGFGGMGGGGMY